MFPNQEFLSAEMKKDNIHSYLLESGVVEKLTNAFTKLMQANVKPLNPMDILREELGMKPMPKETTENLELELDDAHREIRRLRGILKKLGVPEAEWQECDEWPKPIISRHDVEEEKNISNP